MSFDVTPETRREQRRIRKAEREAQAAAWASDRQRLADDYFGGDAVRADVFLFSLPYSEIPGWASAREVMETLRDFQREDEESEERPAHDAAVAAKALRDAASRFRHDRPSASVWAEMLELADQIEESEEQ